MSIPVIRRLAICASIPRDQTAAWETRPAQLRDRRRVAMEGSPPAVGNMTRIWMHCSLPNT